MIRKFFLVDDDEDDIHIFNEALQDINVSIRFNSATNGKELLNRLAAGSEEPEIIFLDINMPEMNGWDVLRRLKRAQALSHIPVLMYSTTSSIIDGKKAVDNGALGIYEKPTNFLHLKDFLAELSASSITNLKSTLKSISNSRKHKVYTD
jgi:CheY-like chemotaxis protein